MIFEFKQVSHRELKIFEMHIACPKESIRASRLLSIGVMEWLFEEQEAKVLMTSCPEGKTANMIRKLGATEVREDPETGLLYFMYVRGE